jgi:tetratricopeptide (TPR) repeat protein
MFRRLGLHAGTDISLPAAAALADVTTGHARRTLDTLANVHLIKQTARDRYQLHDLLRLYAAERAHAEDPIDDRETAIHRELAWYLRTADAVEEALVPSRRPSPIAPDLPAVTPLTFQSGGEAVAWCETERLNLLAAIRQAADHNLCAIAWQLPIALGEFFLLSQHRIDWLTAHKIGLECARHIGDRRGESWTLANLGLIYVELKRFEEAVPHFQEALVILRETGDRRIEGLVLTNLGLAYAGLGQFEKAIDSHSQGLAIQVAVGHRWGQAWALTHLGLAYVGLERLDEAIAHYHQALDLHRETGNQWVEGTTLTHLGEAYTQAGQNTQALESFHQALIIHRKSGHRWAEGSTLLALGDLHHAMAEPESARNCWREALPIFQELNDPAVADIRARLNGSL